MSTATKQLLAAFESLPSSEQRDLVNELFCRLPPYDSGPLDDRLMDAAADDLAGLLATTEASVNSRRPLRSSR